MTNTVQITGKGDKTVIRHFNEKRQLVGYSDKNYAFTCQRNAVGDMVNYQNTLGEKLG